MQKREFKQATIKYLRCGHALSEFQLKLIIFVFILKYIN